MKTARRRWSSGSPASAASKWERSRPGHRGGCGAPEDHRTPASPAGLLGSASAEANCPPVENQEQEIMHRHSSCAICCCCLGQGNQSTCSGKNIGESWWWCPDKPEQRAEHGHFVLFLWGPQFNLKASGGRNTQYRIKLQKNSRIIKMTDTQLTKKSTRICLFLGS